MNYARVAAAAVVAFVVSMGLGFFVNEVLLANVYLANAAAMPAGAPAHVAPA